MFISYPNGSIDAVEEKKFPDGQIHINLRLESLDRIGLPVTINARIRNGDELLSVLLANETLRHAGATQVSLHISYLLGARMDRRISTREPFSLKVVAEILKGKFDRISVVDPHSDVACALLDADPILPTDFVEEALKFIWKPSDTIGLCAPDAGAAKRVEDMAMKLGDYSVVQCLKHRDMATGKLSGFKLFNRNDLPENVLIVDDICDGGRTFSGVAELLKQYGVKWVGLYVTHGIFSNGFEIPNIDRIFTTTSYRPRKEYPSNITVVGADLA